MAAASDLAAVGLLDRIPCSEAARSLLPVVMGFPLGSAGDFCLLDQRELSSVYACLWELESLGLVECHSLGASRAKVNRWWVSERGLEELGVGGLSWQQPWALSQLLLRLPAVEWFYQVAPEVAGLGRMEEFQWFTSAPWDAAARYERGWAAFFWSGILQVESRLREILGELASGVREFSVGGGLAWPSLLVYVASDQWQQEMVLQVAKMFGLEAMVQVWCAEDGSVRGARTAGGGGSGWVYQAPGMIDLGGWEWSDRLAGSVWSQGTGVGSHKLLSLVSEWPAMKAAFGQVCLGRGGGSKHCFRLLKQLVDLGLVERSGGRKGRYRLSKRGYWVLAGRDRVWSGRMLGGVRGPVGVSAKRLAQHEDGLMGVAGGFISNGVPVAAGWRWLGGVEGGLIMPDGMVNVGEGPFGPGWHFFEYERYVRGEFRAQKKLSGYLSSDRRESWPLLVAVWNDDVERLFHGIGQERGLLMLTTTMDRLRRHGPAGNSECWSMYGRKVYLGGWDAR